MPSLQRVFSRLHDILIGKPLDLMNRKTKKRLALAALLAWIGLGADGLSSSSYGPEQAFIALGSHTHLSLYLALATAITVFVISLAYNQVIELFPTGGGGYRVATKLIGPYSGLVSGAALIIDYVLTMTISIAAGVDALFSLFTVYTQDFKIVVEMAMITILLLLNLRGVKESILVLLPIFLGFFLLHIILIAYGIYAHADILPTLIPDTIFETQTLVEQLGWVTVAAFFLRAYSLGAGTYTGIEAVSNNVQMLVEPRVRTGKVTMLYMAMSLSALAAGLITLYLLWHATPQPGQTLNAVVFRSVIEDMGLTPNAELNLLTLVLLFEALMLFAAANTGILGGTSVLTNMSADSWLPHQLSYLSPRLVTQNSVLFMGIGALIILWWTQGEVDLLVVLYSINVFITFSLSLLGLCIYWIKNRHAEPARWKRRLALSLTGLIVAVGILCITIWAKFTSGGWITLFLTGLLIGLCVYIRSHYRQVKKLVRQADLAYTNLPYGSSVTTPPLDPTKPTAAIIVTLNRSGGLYPLEWIQARFPGYFKNFIFVNGSAVDSISYGGAESLELLRQEAEVSMRYFENYCHSYGIPSKSYFGFGTDIVTETTILADQVQQDFPNVIFFASMLTFENENWITRLLHNKLPFLIQRNLHQKGVQMIILPMKV